MSVYGDPAVKLDSARIVLQFLSQLGPSKLPGFWKTIQTWENYRVNTSFLVPCDSCSFTIGTDEIPSAFWFDFVTNTQVRLMMQMPDNSERILMNGFVDKIECPGDDRGSKINVTGRSFLRDFCDSGCDPSNTLYQIKPGMTLATLLHNIFGLPVIFGTPSSTSVSNAIFVGDGARRTIITGNITENLIESSHQVSVNTTEATILDDNGNSIATVAPGTPDSSLTTTKETKTVYTYTDPTVPDDLKDLNDNKHQLHQLIPHPGDTLYSFAEKWANRFHYHIYTQPGYSPIGDGDPGISVTVPTYNQKISYNFINLKAGGNSSGPNNILKINKVIDISRQPSVIIAKGFSGGGDYASSTIKIARVNEFIGYQVNDGNYGSSYDLLPEVRNALASYPGITVATPNSDLIFNYYNQFTPPIIPRIAYWHDNDSRTIGQLNGAVNCHMSNYMKDAFKVIITVQDHFQKNANGANIVYTHNMIATITDATRNLNNQPMWVESVEYNMDFGGTSTTLTLLPVGVINFGSP